MQETWRWFGPADPISIPDIRQAGAAGIVTALHHIPPGTVWTPDQIERRMAECAPLPWTVVESLPVSEAIKTGGPDASTHVAAWKDSLANLAATPGGPRVICYNFMPVLDWTRTELRHTRPDGAQTMRFDLVDFAAFDAFILARDGAEGDYDADVLAQARGRAAAMSESQISDLTTNIIAGLPGTEEHWTTDTLVAALAAYDGIDADALRANLTAFLAQVAPVAQDLGLRLCCHPDDPPWPLLGLPRVVSTGADYDALLAASDLPANGITFCTGSLGARPDNDLTALVARLGPRIHFLHLRNVRREGPGHPVSFFEDAHLAGNTDMVAVLRAVLAEETRRAAQGRADAQIPMRPDHGQAMLSDLAGPSTPGYPAIGRLRGLAELRGATAALIHTT